MDVKELNKDIRVSIGALVFGVASLVGSTFTVTTIYNKFILQGVEIKQNKSDIKYFSDRADRRLEHEMNDVWKVIEELKKPNSDNGKQDSKKNTSK